MDLGLGVSFDNPVFAGDFCQAFGLGLRAERFADLPVVAEGVEDAAYAPPAARGAIRLSDATKAFQEKGIEFYQSYVGRPEAGAEIMRDLRGFLLGLFYSTSGYCPADKLGSSL